MTENTLQQEAQQKQARKDLEMRIIREVNKHAEQFYPDSVQFGNHAAYAIQRRHRSQLTNLENIAESSFKVSDVYDYVKRQFARYPFWRQSYGTQQTPFGLRLNGYLEVQLAERANRICSTLAIQDTTDEDQLLRRRIHLLLIRQFIRQMVVQYEFALHSST